MKRSNLFPLLLVTSCVLPKFDVVDSFGDEASGGSGSGGKAGDAAANGGMGNSANGGGSDEGGSPDQGGAGASQGGSAGSTAEGGSIGEGGGAASGGDGVAGTAGNDGGGTAGSGGASAGAGGSAGGAGGSATGGAGGSATGGTGGSATGGTGGSAMGGTGGSATGGAGGSTTGGTGGSATAGNGGSGGTGIVAAKNYQYTGSWPTRPLAITKQLGTLTYSMTAVTTRYLAQSCAIGDYNNDGKPDVSSGRRWYEGPAFTVEHVYRGAPFTTYGHDDLPRNGDAAEIETGESDDFSDYPFDVDGDGWTDIINIANPDALEAKNPAPTPAPQPRASAYWYENPGLNGVAWAAHLIHDDVRLEQHGFMDVNRDGKPEFYGACKACVPSQTKGYYQANWSNPTALWTYHPVTRFYDFAFGGTGWLHGMGFGDVNGDSQPDLLERAGVWIDVTAASPNQTACPGAGCGWISTPFYVGGAGGDQGGSHMYAADIDGDGDADVVAADNAHAYGLSWYEQGPAGTFTKRQFMGTSAQTATYGPLVFSQPHALELADMDGDGVPDIITGKSRFAHPQGYGDPDLLGTPYVVVFKGKRGMPSAANGGTVTFEPHIVDSAVGVGHQLAVGHINTDGIMDICVASKAGLYVFLGQ